MLTVLAEEECITRAAATALKKLMAQTAKTWRTTNMALQVDTPIGGDFADFADGAYGTICEAVTDVIHVADNINDKVCVGRANLADQMNCADDAVYREDA